MLPGAPKGAQPAHVCRLPTYLPPPCSEYVPEVDGDGAATGALRAVVGTPLDFQQPHTLGERMEEAGGYQNTYLLFGLGPDTNMSEAVPQFQAADA